MSTGGGSIDIVIDDVAVLAALNRTAPDKARKAMALALNRTAEEFQAAERLKIERGFHLRRKDFILRNAAKILPSERAKPDSLRVTIRVDDKASFMDKFETGQDKTPHRPGGKSISVPLGPSLKRNAAGIVLNAWRPSRLFDGAAPARPASGGREIVQGKNNTFLIRNASGEGNVFRAVRPPGRRRAGAPRPPATIQFLYHLQPKAKTPRTLGFVDTAKQVTTSNFHANFLGFLQSPNL